MVSWPPRRFGCIRCGIIRTTRGEGAAVRTYEGQSRPIRWLRLRPRPSQTAPPTASRKSAVHGARPRWRPSGDRAKRAILERNLSSFERHRSQWHRRIQYRIERVSLSHFVDQSIRVRRRTFWPGRVALRTTCKSRRGSDVQPCDDSFRECAFERAYWHVRFININKIS
jgi:hypothetical protein